MISSGVTMGATGGMCPPPPPHPAEVCAPWVPSFIIWKMCTYWHFTQEKGGAPPSAPLKRCHYGFFDVMFAVHGTYGLTSHPKDEAIMGKCRAQGHKRRAQGHKRRDQPSWDSNPDSDNTRTWVRCTRPLGHDTPQCRGQDFHIWGKHFRG